MVNEQQRQLASLIVPVHYDGKMVKEVIRGSLDVSRALFRKIVGCQGVRVNGEPVYITSRVHAGDHLQLFDPYEVSEDILPEEIPLDVVYEDQDVLVVNKPAGLVVHPTKGHYTGTLANAVVHYWQAKGEAAKFRPVHRIDRNTSGLLVISKNHYANQLLSDQLKKRKFRREYLAVVHGNLEVDRTTIDAPILKKEEMPRNRIVSEHGQRAVTHVVVEKRYGQATLVRLRLETGRTHQIRVHMNYIGHPLYGDDLYGIGEFDGIGRQALHAEILGFYHPRHKSWLEWRAELPDDITALLNRLQTHGGLV